MKGLKGSICNEWSQLEADTTGRPPSVRVAVVVIESFALKRRLQMNQPPPQALCFLHRGGERETRVTRE